MTTSFKQCDRPNVLIFAHRWLPSRLGMRRVASNSRKANQPGRFNEYLMRHYERVFSDEQLSDTYDWLSAHNTSLFPLCDNIDGQVVPDGRIGIRFKSASDMLVFKLTFGGQSSVPLAFAA